MQRESAFQGATATIGVCVAVAFCEGFDLQAAGVAAGGIVADFKPSAGQLGTFFSASTFGLFVGALVGGRLADTWGRKKTLIVAVTLFGLFSIGTAAAQSVDGLCWARLLTGMGLGGALPNVLALVTESSAPRRRSINVALAYSGMPFGGAVASLVSLIGGPYHWRIIFMLGGVAPVILVPILLRVLQESPEFVRVARTPGLTQPDSARSPFAILAEGRTLTTLLLWVSSFLELLILYLLLSWLPTLLVNDGLSKAQAASAQIAFNVGGGLAALFFGRLLESKARNGSIVAAFVLVPVFITVLSRTPPEFTLVALTVFALGCAVLAAQGFLYVTAPRCYPTVIRGMGVGAVVAMGRVGSIVGPKLGGALKAAGHSSSQLLVDILPLAVLGSVAALLFAWHVSRRGLGSVQSAAQQIPEGPPTPRSEKENASPT